MVRLSLPVGIYHPLSSTVHYMSPYTPYPVLRAASANQKDYKLMSNHSYTTYLPLLTFLPLVPDFHIASSSV